MPPPEHRDHRAAVTPERRGRWFGLWFAFPVGGTALLVAGSPFLRYAVLAVTELGACYLAVVQVMRMSHRGRRPWVITMIGILADLVSLSLQARYRTLGVMASERSLLPDLFDVVAYLLIFAGLVDAVRARRQNTRDLVDALMDSLVGGLAVFSLLWALVIVPALDRPMASIWVQLSVTGYVPLAALCATLAAHLAFASRTRNTTLVLVAFAMFGLLIGDVLHVAVETRLVDHLPGYSPQLAYFWAISLFGLSVLHPSFATVTDSGPVEPPTLTRGRVALICAALSTPPFLLIGAPPLDGSNRVMFIGLVALLNVAISWRFGRSLRAHMRTEEALRRQAHHDSLTGLLNRAGLLDALATWAERRERPNVTVIVAGIDRFKLINETFEHAFGDQVLFAVTGRLLQASPRGAIVSRIGAAEFGIAVRGNHMADLANRLAERVHQRLSEPLVINGVEVPMTASLGVVWSDRPWIPEDVLGNAKRTMSSVKADGGNSIGHFDGSQSARSTRRLQLEADLRHALKRQELSVSYQPVIRLTDGVVIGFEALMRWKHTTLGQIPPSEFIPVAEDTGLINELGAWVLTESCRQLHLWRRTLPGGESLTMAINVSARQLRHPALLAALDGALDDLRLHPGALCLELTESVLLTDPESAGAALATLRERGVHLAIDDFGTGFSSLAYLQKFPFDRVKIDRAFVEPLGREHSDQRLIGAIIAMANALGMSTVAEGIESPEQARELLTLGCQAAQGFHYSRPVPALAISTTLARLGTAAVSNPMVNLTAPERAPLDLTTDPIGDSAH